MKKTFLISLALIASVQLFSQEFVIPEGYEFIKAEDYTKYESDIVKGVNWLIETPLNTNENKRIEANKFLILWLTGSPNVSIEISKEVVTFMDCADCLMVFMGGWAKYSLENGYSNNKVKGNLAGIESVIEFYELNKKVLGKNKEIQKYIKLKDKGELEKHIESLM